MREGGRGEREREREREKEICIIHIHACFLHKPGCHDSELLRKSTMLCYDITTL